MALERINPPELGTPSGFSHAVLGEGRVVFLAGQTALDSDGRIVGAAGGAPVARARRPPPTAVRAAGGGAAPPARLTVYIVDMDDYRAHAREIGAAWKRLVGREYPAMAGIGVARLWDAEALVEVQGLAVLP